MSAYWAKTTEVRDWQFNLHKVCPACRYAVMLIHSIRERQMGMHEDA